MTVLSPAGRQLLNVLEAEAEIDASGRRIVGFGTKELAERVGKAHSTVTEQVGRLVREGHLVESRRGAIELPALSSEAPGDDVRRPAGAVSPGVAHGSSLRLAERIRVLVDAMVSSPHLRDELAEAVALLVRTGRRDHTSGETGVGRNHGATVSGCGDVAGKPAEFPERQHTEARSDMAGAAVVSRGPRAAVLSEEPVRTDISQAVLPDSSRDRDDVQARQAEGEPRQIAAAAPGRDSSSSEPLPRQHPQRGTAVPAAMSELVRFQNNYQREMGVSGPSPAGIGDQVAGELAQWPEATIAAAATRAARMMVDGDVRSAVSFVVGRLRRGDTSWFDVPGGETVFVAPEMPMPVVGTAVDASGDADVSNLLAVVPSVVEFDDDTTVAAEVEEFLALPQDDRDHWLEVARERAGDGPTALLVGLAAQLRLQHAAQDCVQ